jgi:hypothetical protein
MHYKVYASELSATYQNLWHLDWSCCRDKVNRAAGRRAGVVFFARHLDYFIVTQNSHPLPGLGTVNTNYRDKKLSSIYRDWQKTRHRDADANSLNRRAVSSNNLDINDIDNFTYRLAPTQLAYGNSRFCILKFTKPADEHHQQAPSASQALTFVYHDRFVPSTIFYCC